MPRSIQTIHVVPEKEKEIPQRLIEDMFTSRLVKRVLLLTRGSSLFEKEILSKLLNSGKIRTELAQECLEQV